MSELPKKIIAIIVLVIGYLIMFWGGAYIVENEYGLSYLERVLALHMGIIGVMGFAGIMVWAAIVLEES